MTEEEKKQVDKQQSWILYECDQAAFKKWSVQNCISNRIY